MMHFIQKFAPLLGRICLTVIFISSGFNKILNWSGTAGYMSMKGMPLVPLFLFGAIVFEIVGGLSVMLGFKARLGAVLLFVFMIPTTLIFHAFWAAPEAQQQMEMIMFMKNLSIMGGLLLIIGMGSGPLSLDKRFQADKE
jgi:putative oxidoreductase